MPESIEDFRSRIKRSAICFEVGGFRPPDDPRTSWFGRVGFALPDEAWPRMDGKPMHALCQINLLELPFRPPRLDDLEFIAVFIGPDELPADVANENGKNWCLRAYRSMRELAPLAAVQTNSSIKPLPMKPRIVEEDYPCWDDAPHPMPPEVQENYHDMFDNVPGLKLGGWPSLVQSEIYWAPWQKHLASPEYVFQIDSTEKGNWMWGDNGVGYFGRGTIDGKRDEWAIEWQCY